MSRIIRYPLGLIKMLISRLLRLFFTALYYPLAPLYDRISETAFLGQWHKWQKASLRGILGKQILEIGCGTGSLYLELLKRGYKVTGLDASPAMLKQAEKKVRLAGLKPDLVRGRVERLPFPDDSFETVVSTFPTEYSLDARNLKEICRVLYPGGRLVIVDTAFLKPFNRRARWLMWFYQNILGYGGKIRSAEAQNQFQLPLSQAGFVRRDETFEDDQGEAHLIIATKVW